MTNQNDQRADFNGPHLDKLRVMYDKKKTLLQRIKWLCAEYDQTLEDIETLEMLLMHGYNKKMRIDDLIGRKRKVL